MISNGFTPRLWGFSKRVANSKWTFGFPKEWMCPWLFKLQGIILHLQDVKLLFIESTHGWINESIQSIGKRNRSHQAPWMEIPCSYTQNIWSKNIAKVLQNIENESRWRWKKGPKNFRQEVNKRWSRNVMQIHALQKEEVHPWKISLNSFNYWWN